MYTLLEYVSRILSGNMMWMRYIRYYLNKKGSLGNSVECLIFKKSREILDG